MPAFPRDIESEFNPRNFDKATDIEAIAATHITENNLEDAFYMVDLSKLAERFALWQKHFPCVEPHYAMKCNPSYPMIRTLRALGAKFDCASRGEIKTAMSLPGMVPEDIIYANPCKQASHLRAAREAGVRQVTFDNLDELIKIKENLPEAEVVLRVITDDSGSACRLSQKFGATLDEARLLVAKVVELGLKMTGISFHVGSGCTQVKGFLNALDTARAAWDIAEQAGIRTMSLLDIGGGFPGNEEVHTVIKFDEVADAMLPKMKRLFPNARFIGEPGRFFAASTYTLCVNIIARRATNTVGRIADDGNAQDDFSYYVNDGLYGSFNCIVFDHAHIKCKIARRQDLKSLSLGQRPTSPVPRDGEKDTELFPSTVFGPTCDGIDAILKHEPMPRLDVGDWLIVPEFGAYTIAAATTFNGHQLPQIHYIARN